MDTKYCPLCRSNYNQSESNNHGQDVCFYCEICESSALVADIDNHGETHCIIAAAVINRYKEEIENLSDLDINMTDREIHKKLEREFYGEEQYNIIEDNRKISRQIYNYERYGRNGDLNLCELCDDYFDNFSFDMHGYDICRSHPSKIEALHNKINTMSKSHFKTYHTMIHQEINRRNDIINENYINRLYMNLENANSIRSNMAHKKNIKKKWEQERKQYAVDDLVANKIAESLDDNETACCICFTDAATIKFCNCSCKINIFCLECLTNYMKERECPVNYYSDGQDAVKCPTCNIMINIG